MVIVYHGYLTPLRLLYNTWYTKSNARLFSAKWLPSYVQKLQKKLSSWSVLVQKLLFDPILSDDNVIRILIVQYRRLTHSFFHIARMSIVTQYLYFLYSKLSQRQCCFICSSVILPRFQRIQFRCPLFLADIRPAY